MSGLQLLGHVGLVSITYGVSLWLGRTPAYEWGLVSNLVHAGWHVVIARYLHRLYNSPILPDVCNTNSTYNQSVMALRVWTGFLTSTKS